MSLDALVHSQVHLKLCLLPFRLNELHMTNEKLRQQLAERERAAQLAQQMRVRSTLGERASQALPYGQAGEIEEPQLRALIAEIENVYKTLREMAAGQSDEAEAQAREDVQMLQNFLAAVQQQRAGRPRSLSPTRELSSSRSASQFAASQPRGFGRQLPGQSLADQTVAAVQQAYAKRQQQVAELRAHWAQTRELVEGVKKCVLLFV